MTIPVRAVRTKISFDGTVRQNLRASQLVLVKRILRKYGYPRPIDNGPPQSVA